MDVRKLGAGLVLGMGIVGNAQAYEYLQTIEQAEARDASGRITVEASTIYVVACNGPGENGGQYYIYEYLNRPGYRAILPPNWGSPIGGRDFETEDEAIEAACFAGAQRPAGCGIGKQWDVVDTSGQWTGVWDRRGDSTTFDAFWQRPSEPDQYAVLDIQLSGNQVTIKRTDRQPNKFLVTDCLYTGTVSADGTTASGTVTCNSGVGVLGPHAWHATIRCEPTGLPSTPAMPHE